jgi:hypothetical protein
VRATRSDTLKTLEQQACSARHRVAPGPHVLALRLAAAAVGATLSLLAALLLMADRPDEASGDLLVLFVPVRPEPAVLAAVAASELTSATPGFAGRLRQHGPVLILPTSPFVGLSLGGCSYLSPERYPRSELAKLRAGPM